MSRRANRLAYGLVVLAVALAAAVAVYALVDSGRRQVLASFSTDLSGRSPDQRHNIERAAHSIDGVEVRPGAEFSFNRVVGLCGVGRGYRQAPAIIDGEVRPSWGGGVCQVSSTLYNAILLANLPIVERHAHSRTVASVPPGLDAAAAFGIADLRFRNDTGFPLRIAATTSPTRLTVSMLGKETHSVDVEIVTERTGGRVGRSWGAGGQRRDVYDASRLGKTVLTYRITRTGGAEAKRELISKDTYAAPIGSASGAGHYEVRR